MDIGIAEIPYESGSTQLQYSRYLNAAGDRWIRHGPFFAYYEDGARASKGQYEHGAEQGVWEDYHPNGQLAARGAYDRGEKVGEWRFWLADGTPEA